MKKFLGKKPVMITFIALAVVMLVVYIGMLVRPVAIGMTYKQKEDGVTITYNFGFKKVKGVMEAEGEKLTMEAYYVCKDNLVFVDYTESVNEDNYKEWKNEVLKNWDVYKEGAQEINAFKYGDSEENATCAGSIVFAIVGGVLELALLAGAGLAVFYAVKKK